MVLHAGVPPDVEVLTGPILLGSMFGFGLYGILAVQVFFYNHTYLRDATYLKGLVYAILFLDTVITAFSAIAAWDMLASGWGDLSVLAPLHWSLTGIPLLSGLVASAVHAFFSWRIYKLSGVRYVPALIMVISVASLVLASYCGIRGHGIGISRFNELKTLIIVFLVGNVICDLLITVAMMSVLFYHRRSSEFMETHSIIGKIITLTVETGMITMFGAILELVFFVVFPRNNMHFIPFLMMAKLYSNSLLATLNSRDRFSGDRGKAPLWLDESFRISTVGTLPWQVNPGVVETEMDNLQSMSGSDIMKHNSTVRA